MPILGRAKGRPFKEVAVSSVALIGYRHASGQRYSERLASRLERVMDRKIVWRRCRVVCNLVRFPGALGWMALAVLDLGSCGCGYVQPRQNQAAQAITITVTPVTASVQVGGTLQFNSTVSNTSNSAVTWWVNGVLDGDAIHGTVSSSGMYTAPATPPVPATVSIKVVSSAASTVTATAAVTIQPQVITVVISPTSASVLAGQTKLFMATVGSASSTQSGRNGN